MKRSSQLAILILLMICSSALALRWGGRTTKPMEDGNWPAGSVEVANLLSRIGYQGSDPGRTEFYYQGDSAAFQVAIDMFAAIRSPKLQLIVRDGPYKLPSGWGPSDMAGETLDWTFTVIDHQSWNLRKNIHLVTQPAAPAPTMTVYIGGRNIEWSKIKVPANIEVTDERADAVGFKNGPVVQADVYDLLTSKPIPGARLAIGWLGPQSSWNLLHEAAANANGRAQLIGFAPGQFRVAAFADGYVPRTADYLDFRGNTFKRYSVFLCPATTTSGTVVDDAGQPLVGVKVWAGTLVASDWTDYTMPDRSSIEATTDEAGRFSLIGLPQGWTRPYATNTTHYQIDALKMLATPRADIVLKMTRTGAIKGRVLDQQGQPVTRGMVRANVPEADLVGTWVGSMQLKLDGTFQFDKVPPGRYVLSNGLAPIAAQPNAKFTEVEVKAGETVEVILRW